MPLTKIIFILSGQAFGAGIAVFRKIFINILIMNAVKKKWHL